MVCGLDEIAAKKLKELAKFIEDKDLSDKFFMIYFNAQKMLCNVYQKTKKYKEASVVLGNLIKLAESKKKLPHNDYVIL